VAPGACTKSKRRPDRRGDGRSLIRSGAGQAPAQVIGQLHGQGLDQVASDLLARWRFFPLHEASGPVTGASGKTDKSRQVPGSVPVLGQGPRPRSQVRSQFWTKVATKARVIEWTRDDDLAAARPGFSSSACAPLRFALRFALSPSIRRPGQTGQIGRGPEFGPEFGPERRRDNRLRH
jgi:hypothetical protein